MRLVSLALILAGTLAAQSNLALVGAVPQPPAGTPPCGRGIDSNLTVTIQGAQSLDAARLCVETQ